MNVIAARKELSERLISYDEKSDITVMKFSFSIEIVPVCRVSRCRFYFENDFKKKLVSFQCVKYVKQKLG